MIKPVLMIHHVKDEMLHHPLEKFILTFDDGYKDHFTSFSKFLEIPTEKIYFITCEWVGKTEFLSINEIKYMSSFDHVTIGAHSYNHRELNGLSVESTIKLLEEDTVKMCDWFETNLGFIPTSFCYPNNNAAYGIYARILKKHGFTDFYGAERIPIESLADPNWLKINSLW